MSLIYDNIIAHNRLPFNFLPLKVFTLIFSKMCDLKFFICEEKAIFFNLLLLSVDDFLPLNSSSQYLGIGKKLLFYNTTLDIQGLFKVLF
jgi:hypothetical protein